MIDVELESCQKDRATALIERVGTSSRDSNLSVQSPRRELTGRRARALAHTRICFLLYLVMEPNHRHSPMLHDHRKRAAHAVFLGGGGHDYGRCLYVFST